MQSMKSPKIIYFLADSAPTPDEAVDMLNYGNNVQVRNSRYIGENDGREECDGVAGSIPAIYSMAPTGEQAIANYAAQVRARMALVGDDQAPIADKPHAVRLMGARTAPGPEAMAEVPPQPVTIGNTETSHPDTTAAADTTSAPPVDPAAPPVEVPAPAPAPAPGKAGKAPTPATPPKGWTAGK